MTYNEAVKQVSAANGDDALNPSNYSITGDTSVTVDSIATVDASTVDLTVTGLVNAGSYSLVISNVEDLSNNPVI